MKIGMIINPFDTLFFRDGKPFDMGEENTANLNFPPSPMTIHRAIISLFLSQNNISISEAEDLKESIKLKNFSLINDKRKLVYPIPLDVLVDKNENLQNSNIAYNLQLFDNHMKHNISNIDKLLSFDEKNKILKSKNVYINEIYLKKYLNNYKTRYYYENNDSILKPEYKIGIGLTKQTNSIDEGKLYRIPLIRMNKDKFNLYAEFEISNEKFKDLDLKNQGYIKIGGENKVSFYEKISDINDKFNIDTNEFNGLFKLYLKTPTIFKNGYIADWMLNGEYKGLKFKFLTCAVGKYKTIGGFDIKENKIKRTLKTVPEGSVYYFKTDEKDFNKIKNIFEKESVSDFYKNEGFGLALVGIGG